MKLFGVTLAVLAAVLAFGTMVYAAEPSIRNLGDGVYQGVLTTDGVPGLTKDVYVDNTARTIQSLYERGGGTWDNSSRVPISMLFTCETKAIRMGFGGSTPTASTLHPFPADSSWDRRGRYFMSTGKFIAGGATDNVHCAMTPVY
jgi:hypothetical protein